MDFNMVAYSSPVSAVVRASKHFVIIFIALSVLFVARKLP
jgi:hypothetical protein